MPKWCVESYPSSLYKFEKTRFWHFVIISGRGQGGPNPCLQLDLSVVGCQIVGCQLLSVIAIRIRRKFYVELAPTRTRDWACG